MAEGAPAEPACGRDPRPAWSLMSLMLKEVQKQDHGKERPCLVAPTPIGRRGETEVPAASAAEAVAVSHGGARPRGRGLRGPEGPHPSALGRFLFKQQQREGIFLKGPM